MKIENEQQARMAREYIAARDKALELLKQLGDGAIKCGDIGAALAAYESQNGEARVREVAESLTADEVAILRVACIRAQNRIDIRNSFVSREILSKCFYPLTDFGKRVLAHVNAQQPRKLKYEVHRKDLKWCDSFRCATDDFDCGMQIIFALEAFYPKCKYEIRKVK